MSALAPLRWLNDELKLQKRVEQLERDLSSGYVFAEILHLHGREPRLEEYRNDFALDAKVHNMEMLGQTLEALQIPFPISTRRAIMMEDRAAILQFLLQLKAFVDGDGAKKKSSSPHKTGITKRDGDSMKRTSRSNTKSVLPPRDLDERFIATNAQRLKPTEVAFRKDVNMAVHLRKFEQAQWEAENELQDFHERSNADRDAQEAAGIHSVRTHLQDKRQFMKEWDREHLKKWKESQRRHLQMERNDLRLELTLEKRREVFRERRTSESRLDAAQGVVYFEKNMARLGLGQGATDQEMLRAIPADDEGAVAHFYSLERRVEELDFRPASNIKMMKELKRRRKAQLAAEKDRRIRKQRAAAEQKQEAEKQEADDSADSAAVLPGNPDNLPLDEEVDRSEDGPDYHTELYLQEKRSELEDNYAKLRESGVQKRDLDATTLQHIRVQNAEKRAVFSQRACSDVVDRLVSLAYTVASTGCEGDAAQLNELKRTIFLQGSGDEKEAQPARAGTEETFELEALASSFWSMFGHWARMSVASTIDAVDIASELQRLASETADISVTTSWKPHELASRTVAVVYTEDAIGASLAQRVAEEHGLVLIQVDELLDECVKFSYDPQKQAEAAASMPERERVLGAFGPKITQLRQKGSPIPEALAVEVVSAAVGLNSQVRGSLLLNFPRTLDEAKLLESALLSSVEDENTREARQKALEAALSPDSDPGEACTSSVDCVISIARAPDELKPDGGVSLKEGEVKRPTTPNRPPTGKARVSIAIQDSPEQLLSQLDEQRAQMACVWERTTHHFKVNPTKLHVDVVVETLHLSLDELTQLSMKEARRVWVYDEQSYPEELAGAIRARRAVMSLPNRFKWAKASNEVDVESSMFEEVALQLNELDKEARRDLQRAFTPFVKIVQESTACCTERDEALQCILHGDDLQFQTAVDQCAKALASIRCPRQLERILTALEVSLGDLADACRVRANCYVDTLSQDPFPDVIRGGDALLQLVPSLFLQMKENALSKLQLLRHRVYAAVPFLRDASAIDSRSCQAVALPSQVASDAMEAAVALNTHASDPEVGQAASEEMLRQLAQIASAFSFHISNEDAPGSEKYTLHEKTVAAAQVARLLQYCALLCRFAQQFAQSLSRLHARSIAKLRLAIRDDAIVKHERIAQVMKRMRASGSTQWPQSAAMSFTTQGVGKQLAFLQREHILLPRHLLGLTRAFHSSSSSSVVATAEFVAIVLTTAQQYEFPVRWRDSGSVARVALQQEYCSSFSGGIHWRRWVMSLILTTFVGLPSIEQMRQYVSSVIDLKRGAMADAEQTRLVDLELSADEFWRIPLWFEDERSLKDEASRELKRLLLELFSTVQGDLSASDPVTTVGLLPMLLAWCVHPVTASSVHPKLASDFLPRYSRGLLRAFHALLLLSDSPALIVDEHAVAKLLEASGVRVDLERLSTTAERETGSASVTWSEDEAAAFLRVCHAYDRDLERLLLLRNSFETIAEQTAASP